MLETRYHHLLATSAEAARARLDAFASELERAHDDNAKKAQP